MAPAPGRSKQAAAPSGGSAAHAVADVGVNVMIYRSFKLARPIRHSSMVIHHEYAAHDEQHNFLAHDDCNRAQRTPQSQRAHVTHENLCRVGVEP